MRRGEIWLYEPPGDKRRPMLVLARNEAINGLGAWVGNAIEE